MPVATTTEAGRQVVSAAAQTVINNATAERARKIAAARAAADTLTPLPAPTIGRAPLETVPDPPLFAEPQQAPAVAPEPTKAARTFSISTVVAYRGRVITIAASGMTLDQFCDLMDDRNYAAPPATPIADPTGWQTLPDGTPICPKHRTPMRKRERQGDTWYSHGVGKGPDGKDIYCKGYHGKDSPGYEVD